jgi:putative endonuclease
VTKQYYIYILTNKRHTVYYVGITNNLTRRIYEHKKKLVEGFTKKYNVDQLVYFEVIDNAEVAIGREKQLKDYRREKKLALIRKGNPALVDLYESIL